MARLTKEEREQLAALADRAKAEDEEDAATELWVKNDDGHQIKLTGIKARRFMAKFGIEDDDEQEEEDPEDDGEQPAKAKRDAKPAGSDSYFRTRKR